MEKSSFFNATMDSGGNFDREYLAEDFAAYFASFIGNGVFPNPSSNLQVIQNSGMNVAVSMGNAWINGYFYQNTTNLIKTIGVADGVLNRKDLVVLRLDYTNREIKCYIKQGTPASTAVAPTLQRDADMYELGLAIVSIPAGATSIITANITDLRLNSSYCGVVTDVVNTVDTTTLLEQYEAAFQNKIDTNQSDFNTWFTSIQNTLSGDTAGNLLNLINANKSTISENEEINNCNIYKTNMDSNGIFKTVEYKRSDGKLKLSSVLSNANSDGHYLTKTETWYKVDGTTTDHINIYTLSYDTDGNCISEVLN